METPSHDADAPNLRAPANPKDISTNRRLKAAVVILSIIIVISAVAFAYDSRPRPQFKAVLSLEWDSNISNPLQHPYIYVSGRLANVGDRAGYGTLHVTVRDSRGWSNTTDLAVSGLLPLEYWDIDLTYDWPVWYNGKSLDGISAPTMKVDTDVYQAIID